MPPKRKQRSSKLKKCNKRQLKAARLKNLGNLQTGNPESLDEADGEAFGDDFINVRLSDLQRLNMAMFEHNKDCVANMEMSSFSIRKRTVSFVCAGCMKKWNLRQVNK